MTCGSYRTTTPMAWMRQLIAVAAFAAVALLHGMQCTNGAAGMVLTPAGLAHATDCGADAAAATTTAAHSLVAVVSVVDTPAIVARTLDSNPVNDSHPEAGAGAVCLALLAAAGAALLSRSGGGWWKRLLAAGRQVTMAAQRSLQPQLLCLCVSRT
ncbi:hypothetical protein [Micromonospora sp. NPDC004704]